MILIHSLYRTYVDEDGTWQWWTLTQPGDRVTGRTIVDGDGTKLIEVEHSEMKAPEGFWAGFFRKPEPIKRLALYRPEQIRTLG